ncbi:hypothetical protein GCK72_023081 [Caenorhabditis remanei]|uniref:Uncharacterized protein n=1 Tax=Caenorhabditis remanei TaxID=31234 RepID=A0A6A5FVU5_CAERE|nr:hypothetical protein GCK72_023081 [Caenorhabditis remanei]KAF1746624.1 hypothetical protein GCK72_023081 [Caenorhabditis remanei]
MGSFNKQVDSPVMTGESSFTLSNQSIEQSRSTINANLSFLADLDMLELKNFDNDFTFIQTIGIADLAANPRTVKTYPEFYNFITTHNPSCYDPSSFDGYVMEETLEAPSVEKYRKLFNEMLHLMYFNCHLECQQLKRSTDDGSEMQKEFRGVYPYKSKVYKDTLEGCDEPEKVYGTDKLKRLQKINSKSNVFWSKKISRRRTASGRKLTKVLKKKFLKNNRKTTTSDVVGTPTVVKNSMQSATPRNYQEDGHFENLQVESINKENTPVADVTHSRKAAPSRSFTLPKLTYAPYKKNPTRRLIIELCQISADTPSKQIATGLSNLSVSPLLPINEEINHSVFSVYNTYERSPFALVSQPNSSRSGTNSTTENSANERRQRYAEVARTLSTLNTVHEGYSPDSDSFESHQ